MGGAEAALPDPATNARILILRIGRVNCVGVGAGGGSIYGPRKYIFLRDNSLSLIIHRQVHPKNSSQSN